MEKFGKSFKRVVVGIIMTAAILITVNPVGISLASELSDLQETSEDSTENIYSNDDSGGITEQSLDDTDDFIEEDIPVLGSGVYGKELNRQGYQVQVTSYVEGAKVSTFKEGILRYQDQYVFCYNPGKRFKETDNVTIHDEVPAEFTEEQGKTISMMIYYIFNNYNLIGEEGAINYYLGQCVIWNYINSINPAFNPYRIYITDSTSAYTVEQQEAALNTILTWVDANKNDYYTSIRYWTNNDGDYQPVIFGWAYPVEKKGMIEVQKYSADTELTSDNKNYSLEGAIYGVYASEADAFLDNNRITIITTGQDGIGISGELSYDTYYVKELVSPPSYELDGNIYQVTINALVPIPVVSSAEKPYPGKIRLTKVSDNENLTNNNSSYSLEGAVYGVYETNSDAENCSNAVDTITTDKQGFGESGDLPLGTYYVKETVASKGFTLDTKVYKVDIDETVQSQTVSSYEKPQTDTAPLVVIKKDDESDDNYEMLYLKDAVFEVRYYAAESESEVNEATYKRHWYLRTDSNGRAYLKSDYLTSFDDKTSDDFYYNELNEPVLPLGYITVQEVKSPEGYVLDDAVTIRKVMPGMNETQRENECIVENSEKKQSFQLIKLAEDGTSDFKPLANAGFMACKISDLSLDTEGGYIFDETKAVRLTVDGNREMFTDEDGYAISDELRYGTYLVHETTVPIGYMPVADFLITVSEDSRSPQSLIYVTDMQKKYYLRVTKIDSTTKHPVLYNSAAYKIWSYKDNDYISFKTFTGSEYEMTDTFKTDDSGVLMLPEPITYGDYRLVEVSAPDGYNIDNPYGIDFSIDDNTIYITTENLNDTISVVDIVYSDTPVPGELSLVKMGEIREYDEDKGDFVINTVPLEGIEFGIYADEDIYTLDGSKTKIYEAGELAFTIVTDEEGKALQHNVPLGKYVVKELNTPEDFVKTDDVVIDFNISDKESDEDGGYYVKQSLEILNKSYFPKLKTTACDGTTGDHTGTVSEKITIIDKIDCTNLVVGRTYKIKGKLYDTSTKEIYKDDDGDEVTAEFEFTAEEKDQTINLEFTFNSKNIEGETVTVFEDLYSNDKKVASHSDISDSNQQVSYPRVRTTAKDKNTESHTGIVSENVTLVDAVECTNLIVGKEYTVKGKLYNTETGEPFKDGQNDVTSEKTFTAVEKNMTVELEFTFDSTSLMGKTIVVFEDLYHNNIRVAGHARLDDKEQQVHYPMIETTAKNAVDGGKIASPNKKITLNDTVSISNVDVGEELVIRGVIYDKSTGEKLLIDGSEVWADSKFTSVDNNMKTDVVFNFDASELAGKSVVLYEYMYIAGEEGNEVLVASHEDINYEGQTIFFSDEPKTGDKDFTGVIALMVISVLGITIVGVKIKKMHE